MANCPPIRRAPKLTPGSNGRSLIDNSSVGIRVYQRFHFFPLLLFDVSATVVQFPKFRCCCSDKETKALATRSMVMMMMLLNVQSSALQSELTWSRCVRSRAECSSDCGADASSLQAAARGLRQNFLFARLVIAPPLRCRCSCVNPLLPLSKLAASHFHKLVFRIQDALLQTSTQQQQNKLNYVAKCTESAVRAAGDELLANSDGNYRLSWLTTIVRK